MLKRLLARPELADTALVVNAFGEVGIDHLLVASAVETTLVAMRANPPRFALRGGGARA